MATKSLPAPSYLLKGIFIWYEDWFGFAQLDFGRSLDKPFACEQDKERADDDGTEDDRISYVLDDFGLMGTIIGEEANLGVVGGGVAKTKVAGEGGDAAGTVAAHSGEMAVAVVITHGEVKSVGGVLEQEEAVGADTETAMTDMGYLVGG